MTESKIVVNVFKMTVWLEYQAFVFASTSLLMGIVGPFGHLVVETCNNGTTNAERHQWDSLWVELICLLKVVVNELFTWRRRLDTQQRRDEFPLEN